jgi:hypothetical protein
VMAELEELEGPGQAVLNYSALEHILVPMHQLENDRLQPCRQQFSHTLNGIIQ